MVVVVVVLIGAWDRVRSGRGRVGFVVVVSATVFVALVVVVHLPPAQFGVVRVGAVVRNGGVVILCCCCEEREAMVLCPRDGRGVPLLRVVVLTSSERGARVDEDLLSSCEVVREAVVPLLRGEKVSCEPTLGRVVPLGTRVGGVGF